MSCSHFPVAAIQITSSDEPDSNWRKVTQLVHSLFSEKPVRLVVLPENFLCFSALKAKHVLNDVYLYVDKLKALARHYDTWIVAGSIPFSTRPDGSSLDSKFRSTSLLISPSGCINARYDKLHLFDVEVEDGTGAYRESNSFEPGDKVVVEKLDDSLNLGMSICYDIRFPELYTEQRRRGVDLLTVPAAFTWVTGKAHWEVLLRARAIETQSFLIAANQVGDHGNNRQTWGHSMILDPWGRVLASCESKEGFCSAELDMNELQKARRSMPIMNHRREFLISTTRD